MLRLKVGSHSQLSAVSMVYKLDDSRRVNAYHMLLKNVGPNCYYSFLITVGYKTNKNCEIILPVKVIVK